MIHVFLHIWTWSSISYYDLIVYSVIFRDSQLLYFSRQSVEKNSFFWEKLKQAPTLILETKTIMNIFNVEIKEPTSDSLRGIILRVLMILQKKQRC